MRYSARQYANSLYELLLDKSESEQKKLVSDFAKTLTRHNRLNLARAIVREFEAIWNDHNGILEVRIESPEPSLVAKALKAKWPKSEISEKADPSLLGGARITIGDTRIDNTLKRRIADLQRTITS